MSRRLALVSELPETVQELVRKGELSAHAAMKHLVPLAPALAAHGLSSRQVGMLCAAWQAGTPESRTLILSDPLLVLRAEDEARRPKELLPRDKLLGDVAAIAAIARRARRLALGELGSCCPGATGETTIALTRRCCCTVSHIGPTPPSAPNFSSTPLSTT